MSAFLFQGAFAWQFSSYFKEDLRLLADFNGAVVIPTIG